jgi:hypothetical protein
MAAHQVTLRGLAVAHVIRHATCMLQPIHQRNSVNCQLNGCLNLRTGLKVCAVNMAVNVLTTVGHTQLFLLSVLTAFSSNFQVMTTYVSAAPWNKSPCLPCPHAAPSCSVDWLSLQQPSLPANAVWTATNGCNVPGTNVPAGSTCAADCLSGFVKTGNFTFTCMEVDGEAGSQYWGIGPQDLTCTGAAAVDNMCVGDCLPGFLLVKTGA